MARRMRGRDLRQERRRYGLSQAELADELRIHKSLVSATETEAAGEYPSPEFVQRWVAACERLGVAA